MIWVLDASVAVKWFFTDEPARAHALDVRERLANWPSEFAVPHLFMSEMVHVLARKSGGDGVFVKEATRILLRLGLRTLGLDESAWQTVAEWSSKGLSGYDATYAALATALGGRWLTADAAAARKLGGLAASLNEWPAQPAGETRAGA